MWRLTTQWALSSYNWNLCEHLQMVQLQEHSLYLGHEPQGDIPGVLHSLKVYDQIKTYPSSNL
jgi:hypothetical protein